MMQFPQPKRVALSCALCAVFVTGADAAPAQSAAASSPASVMLIRFMDSATGYALRPDVTVQPEQAAVPERSFGPAQVAASGQGAFALEAGRHNLTVAAAGYQPMSAPLVVPTNNTYQIQVLLDPVELPYELRHESIQARQREGATLIQGFIVDDDAGEPLRGVRVASSPSGVQTVSDARGFYEIYVPVPEGTTEGMANVSVAFEKPGYQAQEQMYWELWSRGDWTHNVRLQRGGGRQVVDGRKLRRDLGPEEPGPGAKAASLRTAPPSASTPVLSAPLEPPLEARFSPPPPTDPTNATVRVPRNIRVEDNGVIYYVTMDFYEKHTLPHEWFASWGQDPRYPGGTNALNAGAVAVRCYAISRINNRADDSTHDICGDSKCQNFAVTGNPSDTINLAVEYTAGCVLINASGNIPSTEYSSENNSLDRACGDGFTAPTGGCLYDPVCSGRTRLGHGRGMCQYGSKFWAWGNKGFPPRDWVWILYHYYPSPRLVRGSPLLVGDNVRAEQTLDVRACADGGIDGGTNCPLITTKATGQTGVIIAGGPLVVTNDGRGFTWYKIRWNDTNSTVGWSCESFLERLFSAPSAPASLTATASATNRIDLSWTQNGGVQAGFLLERAPAAAGPWLRIAQLQANVTTFRDGALAAGSTWYYRVKAYNAAGESAYTAVASATTPAGVTQTLALHDLTITPGTPLTLTNVASAPDRVALLTDFEPFMSETANGVVMFRNPRYSSTTSTMLGTPSTTSLLSDIPDLAAVTDTYPTSGHGTGQVLRVSCQFTNPTNPWLLLTTANATTLPNPVINLTGKLRFDVYAADDIKVAVGCREATIAAGTAMGSNGGTSGAIEWAGVTDVSGTAPMPARTVVAGVWTTLTFDLPQEPVRSFSGGNGVLSTASGLGVLEHLAIVPAAGIGVYDIYLDNFAVLVPRTFTYSLGAGAPANASINAATGVFTWTPTQAQSPSTNQISIIVTDNSSPPLRATNTFAVVVRDSVPNSSPMLAPIGNQTAYAGSTLLFTNLAYDLNPADTLTFSLDPGAPPAAYLNPVTGVFSWTPTPADTNSVHPITVRVADNGSPVLSATASFSVTVLPPNLAPMLLPIANRSVNVGSLLVCTNLAFDPDGHTLTFSLGGGAPTGATIQPGTGVFSWTPPDAASNTTHTITVRVTDNGVPPLSATASFDVTVLPRLPNHPPVLSPIAGRTVHAGSAIVFTNSASDPDAADTLIFGLDDTAPSGAEIDIVSGVFAWTPTDAQSNTTNHITVSVSDDGEPPLSASASFSVTVRSRPVLQAVSVSGTAATLSWSAIPDVTYRLQYKTNLLDSLWQTLGPDITATNTAPTAVDTGLGANPQRFYRVRVMN